MTTLRCHGYHESEQLGNKTVCENIMSHEKSKNLVLVIPSKPRPKPIAVNHKITPNSRKSVFNEEKIYNIKQKQ